MIDKSTIQRILDATDIVDVVKEFVTLRKSGANYKGLCPFHNEKTPSFTVSPARQLCKCFSCGKGGNAVSFVMELEQMTYPEAIKWLGRRVGIEVQDKEMTDEERVAQSTRESMFAVNEWANRFFQDTLHNGVDGVAQGMAYLRSRGIRDDMIAKFGLGFSPQQREALAHAALSHGFKEEYLLKTGVCYKKDGSGQLCDRFHGRVIFPVFTVSGKVVAFGGRILSADKNIAKYVNSPESEIYSKSHELYGLYQAKSAIVKQGNCFLVEGYTDVISMHQSGIENVVASSGTSLTEGQVRLLHRFTENITVLYDGDAAGIKASLRGIDMLLSEGLNVKVLLLPDGDDPDSFARKHRAEELRAYIDQHQVDFIKFKTDLLLSDAKGDPLKRAELIEDVVKSISVIPNRIVQQTYIQECAQKLQVAEELIVGEINKQRVAKQNGTQRTESSGEARKEAPYPTPLPLSVPMVQREEELLVTMVIRYANLPIKCRTEEDEEREIPVAQFISEQLQTDNMQLPSAPCRQILEEALSHCTDNEWNPTVYFNQHTNVEISTLASRLSEVPFALSSNQQAQYVEERYRLEEVVPRLVHDFKHAVIKVRLKELLRELARPEVMSNPEKYNEVLKEYMALCHVERMFAQVLGDRVVLK